MKAIHRTVCTPLICSFKRVWLAVLAIVAIHFTAFSQDIHFSQFDQAPFNLNPALTGNFDGQYRFIGNQRSQWRSVTEPYRTTGLAVDGKNLGAQQVHGGISLFHDQAGDSRLRNTIIQLSAAKEFALNADKSTVLVPGISLGITSMRIDYSALQYDNQWNGLSYDPLLDPGESFARSSRAYFNLNAGAIVQHKWEGGRKLTAGLAFFNLSSPRQSFFDDGYVRLDPRINLHATWIEPINAQWQVWPSMLVMTQGKYREWDLGGTAHYIISPKPYLFRAIYAGMYYRTRDAGFVVAGVRFDEWNVGLSYDINTSGLRPASAGRGGFELSVIYIMAPKPTSGPIRKVCPDYI